MIQIRPMLGKFIVWLDKAICTYLGLENNETVKPFLTGMVGDRLFVSSTTAFKRHSYTQTLESLLEQKLIQIGNDDKKKLGIALGKAIANNLVISFEMPLVKNTHKCHT